MPITLQNGAEVPIGSDPYNLAADLLKLAKSLNLPIIVGSEAERDNLPDKYDGMAVVRTDQAGIAQTYTGGLWYGERAVAQTFSYPLVPASGSVAIDITYPAGLFPGIPRPLVNAGSGRLNPGVFNLSATGFSMTLDNATSAGASAGTGVWLATYSVY